MKREIIFKAMEENEECMMQLATTAYENGEYNEAFYWLLKCAKKGNGFAMLEVSKFYRYGIGVDNH